MQAHTLQRKHPNRKTKLIGRGGTRGKTAGRGTKGQNARAGHKKRPEIRDFIKRIPKLRGRGKNLNTTRQSKPFAVNLGKISTLFKNGDVVSPATLVKAGVVTMARGSAPRIKILATGVLDKKVTIKDCSISATAKLAVEKAGGNVLI